MGSHIGGTTDIRMVTGYSVSRKAQALELTEMSVEILSQLVTVGIKTQRSDLPLPPAVKSVLQDH